MNEKCAAEPLFSEPLREKTQNCQTQKEDYETDIQRIFFHESLQMRTSFMLLISLTNI
jgi:hypothetical protein